MKEMKKMKSKVKTAGHKDAKQDKVLINKMMKKEVPKMKGKGC